MTLGIDMTSDSSGAGRLRDVRASDLTPEQQPLWDAVIAGPRGAAPWMITNGVLAGPFNAWLQVPDLGVPLAATGERLRFGSLLDPITRELVILTVGAHWNSEFEFWAHSGIGRSEGMSDVLIEAIATQDAAGVHRVASPAGRAAYAVTRSLLTNGHPSIELVNGLRAEIGDAAAVEVVALAGYYTTVSFTLNAFRVPLPDGVTRRWPDR